MRIAVLIKQVPVLEDMALGPDGRLQRDGHDHEMNPYCRRAVAEAVRLSQHHNGRCTAITMGPDEAEAVLREAIAWATLHGVEMDGVLLSDPAFAGSDTLATAQTLSAALRLTGPFDLILLGRNSVDADTGQIGPEVAQLLDLPFGAGVRYLNVESGAASMGCEQDDGYSQIEIQLPAVLSAAERLIEPAKVDPAAQRQLGCTPILRIRAADLGAGPWGQAASPTRVGAVRAHYCTRDGRVLSGTVDEQVHEAVELLMSRGALGAQSDRQATDGVPPAALEPRVPLKPGSVVAVLVERGRPSQARELLGKAAQLAAQIGGSTVAMGVQLPDATILGAWGADQSIELANSSPDQVVEEDISETVAEWATVELPWAVLAPSTMWGREVAGRVAVRLRAGLTGDAVDLEVGSDGRLVAWKPAFGGQLVAAVHSISDVQMATVRAGVLPLLPERCATAQFRALRVERRGRIRVLARDRDDDLELLQRALTVVGVGTGVSPERYDELQPLLQILGAELAATRKVTDRGWLPRLRQIGITGQSISPSLYIALGLSGKFNHMVGLREAGTILAVNTERDAPVFAAADIGIIGDWQVIVPKLATALSRHVPSDGTRLRSSAALQSGP